MLNKEINKKVGNFAFFGTSEFAVIFLDELLKKYSISPSLIVTTVDKPVGRKQILTPPPVKKWAIENNIPCSQPERLKEDFGEELKKENFDFFLVASYGKIIPERILKIAKIGCINIHPSLLPRYRGPSPIQSQILNNEKNIGISIILMDKEVDHGPIIAQKKIELMESNSMLFSDYVETEKKLAVESALLFSEILPQVLANSAPLRVQDDNAATFTKMIRKEDGLIDLKNDPEKNFLKYLAFRRWPGVYFFTENNMRVIIKEAEFVNGDFKIIKVIPEGRNEMSYDVFLKMLSK